MPFHFSKIKKMKINIYLLLLLILSGMLSCDPDPINIDDPTNADPELDSLLIWKVPLHEDTIIVSSINHIGLYKDKIVTSANPFFGDEGETLLCFDTAGVLQWQWNGSDPNHKILSIYDAGSIDNYFYFISSGQTFCIDITTGTELWDFPRGSGSPRLNSSKLGYIF